METVQPLSCKVFQPFGAQLKEYNDWYPQELCNDWPAHQASALSLGESSVVKLGLNYPLRTGIHKGKAAEQVFKGGEAKYNGKNVNEIQYDGFAEEMYFTNSLCVVSNGPIGGPSKLHALYRPLLSYGTGSSIRSIAKTSFPDSRVEIGEEEDMYICLAEEGGISMYSENSCETHVSHVPEFRIDKILPCAYGLLVIPFSNSETENEKGLYILTHPIKQISKIWIKNSTQGKEMLDHHFQMNDFSEYDSQGETLVAAERNLMVFMNHIQNRIIIRRLNVLSDFDMHRSRTLNVTASRGDVSSRYLHSSTPSGGIFSPHVRQQRKPPVRINREGGSVTYWPSFDFSEATSRALGIGFYPPHVCIFDDPELNMTTIYHIDLGKSQAKNPKKCQLSYYCTPGRQNESPSLIAVSYLVKSSLYIQGIDINCGVKLSNNIARNILDYTCAKESKDLATLVTLGINKKLQVAWLDKQFKIVGSTTINLEPSIENLLERVDNILFHNTIICATQKNEAAFKEAETSITKIKIQIVDWKKDFLICKCVETISNETANEQVVSKLIVKLAECPEAGSFKAQWARFVDALFETIREESADEQCALESKIHNGLDAVKENFQLLSTSDNHVELLRNLCQSLQQDMRSRFPRELLPPSRQCMFLSFEQQLTAQLKDRKSLPNTCFNSLPEFLRLLLGDPDAEENLCRLAEMGSSHQDLTSIVDILMTDVFYRNRDKVGFGWPMNVLRAAGRFDYLSGYKDRIYFTLPHELCEIEIPLPTYSPDEHSQEQSWTSFALSLRIFARDRRLEEVCRMLDSSNPILVTVQQKVEKSDQDFADEQEKFLLQRVQISFAAPVGRAAFTLRTEEKSYADLTSSIFCPKLCTTGKCAYKGTTLELPESEISPAYTAWPLFHNSVASAVAVKFKGAPADAWFAFNKSKNPDGSEQAGTIYGFGLNGILKCMPPTLRHDHLAKENSFTTMSMLLGLAANLVGTGDLSTWKLISLHIGAMLPACTTELEIPKLATLVAPCALGLLFLGTHNNHISKILLGEIAKKFNPLSVFAGGSYNNSVSTANVPEVIGVTGDREAHSLCAGFGLGFVSLGKGRLHNGSLVEDSFDGILRRFVVGGPKPASAVPEDDLYTQNGQTLPSLWEEYRCCHIEEGENVNVDVTTPSAIIAVALIYLRSGNEAVLTWLSSPSTLHQLDGVRPDLLTLRALASVLVFEEIEDISAPWLERKLMPKTLQKYSQIEPEKNSRLDHESINQAWASIVCGISLGLGIRYAGTSDERVKNVLWHYAKVIKTIGGANSKIAEYFPKNFLDSCVCTLLISLSLLQAGTGDIPVLKLARYLQTKIGCNTQTVNNNFYGLEMCISMATGILFLGGGRYSLSNDDKSIAVILASVFPKWPTNANDNRYHLQALRHLYILAAQPRLILPKPMPHGSELIFHIEYLDGQKTDAVAPVLLPPFHLLKRIWSDDSEFYKIEFILPEHMHFLQNIVEDGGQLTIMRKPIGALSHKAVKQLEWKHEYEYHHSLQSKLHDPVEEQEEAKSIKEIGLLGGWNNVNLSALLSLRKSDLSSKESQTKVKILNSWIQLSKEKGLESCLTKEILASFVKNPKPFKVIKTEVQMELDAIMNEIKTLQIEAEKAKEAEKLKKKQQKLGTRD